MRTIPLVNSTRVAFVDDHHYDRLAAHEWREMKRPKGRTSYAVTKAKTPAGRETLLPMHRLVMGLLPGDPAEVDHRNNDGLDNREANLRTATRKQNLANTALRQDTTSGYKGVSFHAASHRWRSRTGRNGQVYLGLFVTRHEAALAYNLAAEALYGPFAHLNDIPLDKLPTPEEQLALRRRIAYVLNTLVNPLPVPVPTVT